VDEKRLSALLDAYVSNLKRFAEISGSERRFQQMSVLADEMRGAREDIRQGRGEQRRGFEDMQRKLDDINQACATVPKPQEVKAKISALKEKMLARADEAEAEYNRGYESLNAFRTAAQLNKLSSWPCGPPMMMKTQLWGGQSWPGAPSGDGFLAGSGRLKGGCGQDCPPHKGDNVLSIFTGGFRWCPTGPFELTNSPTLLSTPHRREGARAGAPGSGDRRQQSGADSTGQGRSGRGAEANRAGTAHRRDGASICVPAASSIAETVPAIKSTSAIS
jgi:hypothetical protein